MMNDLTRNRWSIRRTFGPEPEQASAGLTVACRLDESNCAKGVKVTDAEVAALNIQPAAFHDEGYRL
jgi:hypothetical protein